MYAIALFERAVTQSHGTNDSFLPLCHTYERSDHAWKLFRKAFGTCHALYTVFIERNAYEQKPHFCWSLGPLFFYHSFFFFTDRSGYLSKSFSWSPFSCHSFFFLLTEADIFLKASLINGVITEYSATLLSRFRRLFQYSFP